MMPCPICGHEDVIFSGNPKYGVEGRLTALCPHGEAHGRAGMAYTSIRYFADTGELLGPVSNRPWEIIYATGVPLGVDEDGRHFGAPFLFEYCGVRGLKTAEVLALSADPKVAPLGHGVGLRYALESGCPRGSDSAGLAIGSGDPPVRVRISSVYIRPGADVERKGRCDVPVSARGAGWAPYQSQRPLREESGLDLQTPRKGRGGWVFPDPSSGKAQRLDVLDSPIRGS